ncbi:hypothetical protein V8C26DRAFT_390227 [Trichoderma gracile]
MMTTICRHLKVRSKTACLASERTGWSGIGYHVFLFWIFLSILHLFSLSLSLLNNGLCHGSIAIGSWRDSCSLSPFIVQSTPAHGHCSYILPQGRMRY